jgi:limonene-1,2-epoxide hydrolase
LGITQEQAVRDFLLEWECESLDDSRIERLLNRMTPDIRWHVNAWDRPIVGQDAVREEFLRLSPHYRDYRSEILAIASMDQTVFTQRLDSMMVGRKPLTQHIAGAYEVDTESKISVLRDYFDRKEVDAQLA